VKALGKKMLFAVLAAASVPAVLGEPPKAAPVKPAPARSVFVMPVSTRDGRDPFFPESTRPYDDNPAAKQHELEANAFAVKGFSIEHGRAMVIINNHTFAEGDEGDVLTTAGRVHIRLIAVRPDAAVIEVNGNRRELGIGNK
jgi:hypothetical protein